MAYERFLKQLGGSSSFFDKTVSRLVNAALKIRKKDLLSIKDMESKLADEFNHSPHTPETINSFFRTIWEDREKKLGIKKLTFFDCPYSQKEIQKLESEGRRIGYIPPELAEQENRHLMAIIWPELIDQSTSEKNDFTNENPYFGWFDYEATGDFCNPNLNEKQLGQLFEKEGRQGMNLNQYIIASQDSKLFTDHYLDENTWSRLLNTKFNGNSIDVCFGDRGRLIAYRHLESEFNDPRLGGRSIGRSINR